MNEEDLKRKLSVLKSVPVPRGYWESYWPRLCARLAATAQRHPSPHLSLERRGIFKETLSPEREGIPKKLPLPSRERVGVRDGFFPRLWIPAFAALAIGLSAYWLGRQSGQRVMPNDQDLRLASDAGESQARRVFKEMLELFPNRVNWISFVDGKVDFSISSAAYPDARALIPLVVSLPRAKEAFETRVLVRPGQSVSAAGQWDKETRALIQVSLAQDGRRARVSCRFNETAGVDTDVEIVKEGTQPLGSFRWGDRLIEVQLTRPEQRFVGKKHADNF